MTVTSTAGPALARSPQEAAREANAHIGAWVAGLRWDDVPGRVRERVRLVLLDSLGVCLVGSRQTEQQSLLQSWRPESGPSPVVGGRMLAAPEPAVWLNAAATVRLELDEGNKYARGHPAAHGWPAVLALAADDDCPGPVLMAALLASYEVAARYGRAARLRPGAHPHGSWGVAGAAAGCARVLGLDEEQTAAAVDTGAGMPIAGHFASALDGNPVRDAWISASNLSGLAAARMAKAGVARNTGTAAGSLGDLLGELDATVLDDGLGDRWDVELGYFKRHASCSFTHPAADVALTLRERLSASSPHDVEEVVVETHSLGAGLSRTTWDTRLGAMFSTPFVVAAALVHGHVDPTVSDDEHIDDATVRALAQRVRVVQSDDLDARLPHERAARVRIRVSGDWLEAETPNPVGDTAYHPFGRAEVVALLRRLLGDEEAVGALESLVDGLPTCEAATEHLQRLAWL